MSPRTRSHATLARRFAPVFAALGDETRLSLVAALSEGERRSIAELTTGLRMSRQAVTKHLRVLERAQLVHSERSGRESVFELDPDRVREVAEYAEVISAHWDRALGRLKAFVEDGS